MTLLTHQWARAAGRTRETGIMYRAFCQAGRRRRLTSGLSGCSRARVRPPPPRAAFAPLRAMLRVRRGVGDGFGTTDSRIFIVRLQGRAHFRARRRI